MTARVESCLCQGPNNFMNDMKIIIPQKIISNPGHEAYLMGNLSSEFDDPPMI